MCQNNGIIIGIFLLKIIALLIIPSILIFFKIRKVEDTRIVIYPEIIILSILLLIGVFGSECISNSSIFNLNKIKLNNSSKLEIIKEYNDVSVVEEVQSTDKYTTGNNRKVYYFNNNTLPLSNKKISCGNKNLYFKNIGNNITAVSMMLSTELGQNIDPIKLLNLTIENEIFDCESGVNTTNLLGLVSNKYNVSFKLVSRDEAINSINNGNIVMAEINNNMSSSNISCESSYIILYKINKEGKYNILNPNDTNYNYVCPENSIGYGTIIKANSNNRSWDKLDIDSMVIKYIVIER